MAAFLLVPACSQRETGDEQVGAPVAAPAEARRLEDLPAPYNTADLAAGAAEFGRCRNCHSLKPDEGHKIGPNLAGLFRRAPGAAEGFRYSPALAAYEAPSWTPEALDSWLADPKGFLPGSSMTFNGVADAADRTNLIAYLLTAS